MSVEWSVDVKDSGEYGLPKLGSRPAAIVQLSTTEPGTVPAFRASETVRGEAFVPLNAERAIVSEFKIAVEPGTKLFACASASPVKKSKPTGLALPTVNALPGPKLLNTICADDAPGITQINRKAQSAQKNRAGRGV